MKEIAVELVVEIVAFVGLGIIGSFLGLLGYSMEMVGITNLTAGDQVLGLWYLVMGSLALFVAVYLIGFQELPARFDSIRARFTD
ncbi:MAG: hypothetical protein R3324_11035 [Halobacteriales archaeon]|nr:hypothetical protein [Halobacteriales archaeon]